MITIDGLTKRFGALAVLRGVSLDVARGRVTAIVGPNGAGKTTLIKCVLGLARADGGRILFDGERVDEHSDYRARVGYMPQIARFPENLSGEELMAMLTDLRGEGASIDEGLVAEFGLSRDLRKPLRTLSGGTRQKVNAVLAFLFRPDLLILDEPTSGLDPVSSGVLKNKIRVAREEGRTVIVTSHVMSELEELADDVALLLDGQARFAGPVHDLKVRTRQLSLERAVAEMMLRETAA
jgi:Cu-processing system ATP-binding protein